MQARSEGKSAGEALAYTAGAMAVGIAVGKAAQWGAKKVTDFAKANLPKMVSSVKESAGRFVNKVASAFQGGGSSSGGRKKINRGFAVNPFYRGRKTSNRIEIISKEKGTFRIKDWSDYPDEYIRVPDKNKIWTYLQGKDYINARNGANSVNKSIRSKDSYYTLNRLEIHEVEPVKFGGSPTDLNNKAAIQSQAHRKYVTPWWRSIQSEVERLLGD